MSLEPTKYELKIQILCRKSINVVNCTKMRNKFFKDFWRGCNKCVLDVAFESVNFKHVYGYHTFLMYLNKTEMNSKLTQIENYSHKQIATLANFRNHQVCNL